MPRLNPESERKTFSGHYLEVAQTRLSDQYRAVDACSLKPTSAKDVISNETVIFGLFADKSDKIKASLIETERPVKSRKEVLNRSIGELAVYVSSHLSDDMEEARIFRDWELTRQLMYESAATEAGLRFLGGLCVYQHEPLTPLKTAVVYPEIITEWVFHERERIALDIKSFELEHADITRLEKDLLTARPQTIAKICGKAVMCGLTSEVVTEKSINLNSMQANGN